MDSLEEKIIKQTDAWKPMSRTRKILLKWRDKIVNGGLTINNVESLEASILEGGKFHSQSQYSDDGYTQKEAMIDFILAVCPYLSELELYHFIECVLAKEQRKLDNTFLRNNELARYLLAYEMGVHTKAAEIPTVLIENIRPIIEKFSDRDTVNIINHSIRGTLASFKEEYRGFEKLNIPEEISADILGTWRVPIADSETEWCLTIVPPSLPYWFSDIYQRTKPQKLSRPSIINFFKEANTPEEIEKIEEAFNKLGALCDEAASLSENILGI